MEERLEWLMDAMTIDEKLKCLATTVPRLKGWESKDSAWVEKLSWSRGKK